MDGTPVDLDYSPVEQTNRTNNCSDGGPKCTVLRTFRWEVLI